MLILASASPRRLDLLARIGVVPEGVDPADVDESVFKNELPRDHARRLAREKVLAVAGRQPGKIVLAADTVVHAGRRILPKAENETVARQCLELLSGRRHRVLTAIAVIDAGGKLRERLSESLVTLKPLTRREIDAYVASDEWRGKAGGYALQSYAEAFCRDFRGSHSGVVGLPLYETRNLLIASGLDL
ncbi:MAG TPA: Maf family nucleotide pyrophosphatase [Sphingomonas sp.]|jgi:septum formation protein|nr:Maf family nucleotide pyrophosphatase [Sphingomonas sp.]